jgi:hypothetical protein
MPVNTAIDKIYPDNGTSIIIVSVYLIVILFYIFKDIFNVYGLRLQTKNYFFGYQLFIIAVLRN